MWVKNRYCSYCGNPFAEGQTWPRRCANCGQSTYQNPLPVSVVLLPVDGGLLCVRRGIEPGKGKLALPGGFIDVGESWQAAGARELWEETGVRIDPAAIQHFRVMSAPDGTLLVFGLAPAMSAADLPLFAPLPETMERVILMEPVELAFPLHTAAAEQWFQER
jgi:ADP-ribose pyrophosphatase YjhB (NUDIX family)